MNRRTLLRGATTSSIVPVTYGYARSNGADDGAESPDVRTDGGDEGTDDADETTEAADEKGNDAAVTVRIADATDPVEGAGLLRWTAELENATERTVRTTVEYFVDGDSTGNVTLTLEPGETRRPFPQSHRVEPTGRDRELSIRARTENDSAARTISVRGVDELDDGLTRPSGEIAVQPGTSVLFEAGAVDPDASQFTGWWVNGDAVGDSQAGGPWQAVYYAEQNAHYWQYTAESEGTDEITAGIETDDENYRAAWTVTVTPDGRASPSIEDACPPTGSLQVDGDGATDLEIDVADPDGALDRVVWWLGHADVILGVSDVTGATDTASLSIDSGLCHTCPIIAWVIAADGTVTSEQLWEVDVRGTETES